MSRSLEFVTSSSLVELQRALTRSEARYDELVQRAGYGIYRSSPDGRFIEANSVLAALLGYGSVAELLRLDLARDVYLDPRERDRLRQRLAAPDFPDRVETRWKRRDGTPITVRLSVRAVLDAAGEVQFYDGLVEDVTERQRHDELLRRNERMATLGATLAGVAHELNNPLAAIIGFSQLLLKKQWSAEDRAALETISHEAICSATIIKDLLASGYAGGFSIEPHLAVVFHDATVKSSDKAQYSTYVEYGRRLETLIGEVKSELNKKEKQLAGA